MRNHASVALPWRIVSAVGVLPLGALILASLIVTPALADEADEPASATEVFEISQGGLLYDKWWEVLLADAPDTTHPAYPAAGGREGAATWRCKECHGWDYRGAGGAYGEGSHFTGIAGIRDMVGVDPGVIADIVRDDVHGYTREMLSDRAVGYLARFVSVGQLDMDQYIDRTTRMARGDPASGARFYQTICAICHGFDGRTINFGEADDPEFIGTVAQANPWETLHKIRNGQPGVAMVSLSALGIQDQIDILSYVQTLPAE